MSDLVKINTVLSRSLPTDRAKHLVDSFLSGRSKNTIEAYRRDLAIFAKWLGASGAEQAAAELCKLTRGNANTVVLDYVNALSAKGLAAATINRRLAAIRSLINMAQMTGIVDWQIDIPARTVETYRDMRGPPLAIVQDMAESAYSRGDHKGIRDAAIIHLLFDIGLRRGEAASLDVEHVDIDELRIFVIGKGKTQRSPITIPRSTARALSKWLDVRPKFEEEQALFVSLASFMWGHRLTTTGIYNAIRMYGTLCGKHVRPHGLRHAAITKALNESKGDIRKVQSFSRHKDIRVVMRYDDAREDFAGEIAELVALR